MIKKPITIQISNGLEARPVAMLVQVASQYESRIQVESGDKHVNAKSITGMMALVLNVGERVTICAEGTDEEGAIAIGQRHSPRDLAPQYDHLPPQRRDLRLQPCRRLEQRGYDAQDKPDQRDHGRRR